MAFEITLDFFLAFAGILLSSIAALIAAKVLSQRIEYRATVMKREAKDRVENLKAMLADMEMKLAEAQIALDRREEEIEGLRAKLEDRERMISSIQQKLAFTEDLTMRNIEKLGGSISELTGIVKALFSEIAKLNRRISRLEREMKKG